MKQYYYIDAQQQQQGPLPAIEIMRRANMDSLVWTEGMETWKPAHEVDELIFFAKRLKEEAEEKRKEAEEKIISEQNTTDISKERQKIENILSRKKRKHNKTTITKEELLEKIQSTPNIPKAYFIWSLLCTFLISPLFGLIALYNSMQVHKSLFIHDNREKAVRHSERARVWCIAGVLSTLLFTIVINYIKENGIPPFLQ